jgi:hypothetical protein
VNRIKYEGLYKDYKDIIKPSKSFIPKWYKEEKGLNYSNFKPGSLNNITFKNCTPLLESFTSGYIISTPIDLYISQSENGPCIEWKDELKSFIQIRHQGSNSNFPVPPGFSTTEFIWKLPLSLQLPKGYSALITQPFNRYDLPFISLTGIIEGGDFIFYSNGSYPFFCSNTFEGVVPQGTPFLQVIPFKNDDWKAEEDPGLINRGNIQHASSVAKFLNWYRDNFWQRRIYD